MQHTNTPVFMRIGNIHQLKVVFFSVNSNLENAKGHEKAEKIYITQSLASVRLAQLASCYFTHKAHLIDLQEELRALMSVALVHLNKRNALRKSLKLEVLVKLGRRLTSTYRTMKRTDETTSNEQFRQFLASVQQ